MDRESVKSYLNFTLGFPLGNYTDKHIEMLSDFVYMKAGVRITTDAILSAASNSLAQVIEGYLKSMNDTLSKDYEISPVIDQLTQKVIAWE